jgi:hypothetical protein
MTMRRITRDEVMDAYERTGLRPMAKTWLQPPPHYSKRPAGACALTAVCLAEGGARTMLTGHMTAEGRAGYVADALGCSREYVAHYTMAFDEPELYDDGDETPMPCECDGCKDGVDMRRFLEMRNVLEVWAP